jgi:hypothetical protein
MNELPNLEDFQARLADVFLVELADQSFYPLTLIEAQPLQPSGARRGRSDPFELKFHGPGPGYLPQLTHALVNDTMGLVPIFLVPLGPHEDGFLYQAVFN